MAKGLLMFRLGGLRFVRLFIILFFVSLPTCPCSNQSFYSFKVTVDLADEFLVVDQFLPGIFDRPYVDFLTVAMQNNQACQSDDQVEREDGDIETSRRLAGEIDDHGTEIYGDDSDQVGDILRGDKAHDINGLQ
jgi:hypothetical protein